MDEPGFDLVSFVKRLLNRPRRPPHASRRAHPYHAVSIQVGKHPCGAARALVAQRFLAAEAPRLPLAKCDAGRCECRFAHHEDRREEGRRAEDHASKTTPFSGHNARTGVPRRQADQETTFDNQYFEHVGRRNEDGDGKP
jgi:hypothetical protein